jgi:hypothetical protein
MYTVLEPSPKLFIPQMNSDFASIIFDFDPDFMVD